MKSVTTLAATSIYDSTPQVPKYSSHTNVRRNILSADDEKLKFIPFLGDVDRSTKGAAKFKRLVTELEEAYTAKRSESSRESERAYQIRSYLDSWLENLRIGCDQLDLVHNTLIEDEEDEELGLSATERRLLLKSFKNPLTDDLKEIMNVFGQAFENVFNLALNDVILPGNLLNEMVEAALKENRKCVEKPPEIGDRLSTYATLTCLICGAIDCQTHGDYASIPVRPGGDSDDEESEGNEPQYQFDHTRVVMGYEDMFRRHTNRKAKETLSSPSSPMRTKQQCPCGDDCYLAVQDPDVSQAWKPENDEAIEKMIVNLKNKNTRSCIISYTLELPCWQVHRKLELLEEDLAAEDEAEEPLRARTRRPEWYDNKKKILKSDWMDMTSAHLHQERTQANPVSMQII